MNAKHFYIIGFSLLLSTVCHAQIVKGYKLLGGSIGFTRGNASNHTGGSNTDVTLTAINLNVSYGIAVKNNIVNGFTAGFSFIDNPLSSNDPVSGYFTRNSKNRSVAAGVFKRRYLPLGKNFYAFGQIGADFTYSQNDYEQLSSGTAFEKAVTKSYAVNGSLHPGLSYQLNNRFMLDLGFGSLVNIGYAHNTRRASNQSASPTTNTLYLNSNLSLSNLGNISVGFRMLFHNKKVKQKQAS
jgi:hypothetical protein